MLDLDRTVFRRIGKENTTGPSRNILPVSISISRDKALWNIRKIRAVIECHGLRPSFPNHGQEYRAPIVNQIVRWIRPCRLDFRKNGSRTAGMQGPIDVPFSPVCRNLLGIVDPWRTPVNYRQRGRTKSVHIGERHGCSRNTACCSSFEQLTTG